MDDTLKLQIYDHVDFLSSTEDLRRKTTEHRYNEVTLIRAWYFLRLFFINENGIWVDVE